jgi:RNA polymerase sigma-70 factor (ECF subfamily)
MDNETAYITRKLQEGDEETYVFLFRVYYVPLCAYARRYVGRKDIAEEIVSETFFNIWRTRGALEIHSSVKGYLFQAVCKNSLNYLRKAKKEERLDDVLAGTSAGSRGFDQAVDELPSTSMIMADLHQALEKAISQLPPQQQTVFRLKRFEAKKNVEIAEMMGLSVKTVEMHLTRALSALRKNLKEYLPAFLIFFLLNGNF